MNNNCIVQYALFFPWKKSKKSKSTSVTVGQTDRNELLWGLFQCSWCTKLICKNSWFYVMYNQNFLFYMNKEFPPIIFLIISAWIIVNFGSFSPYNLCIWKWMYTKSTRNWVKHRIIASLTCWLVGSFSFLFWAWVQSLTHCGTRWYIIVKTYGMEIMVGLGWDSGRRWPVRGTTRLHT